MSTQARKIYLLDPQKLPPETIAVAFAKTSRSPQSFQDIAAELTDEKSAQFHEKWVVGYGHSSVAEHAVLHIAVENVSRLAVETLQANRLASYTEKSTRYQKWDEDSFFVPEEFKTDAAVLRLYEDTCKKLFRTYQESLGILREYLMTLQPRQEGEKESAYERRLRTQYVDVARFLLPASSLANVGVTINARALEHALCKMLSHPLAEVRQMGEEIKRIAQENVPTLVKYAQEKSYFREVENTFSALAHQHPGKPYTGDWCVLVDYDQDAEEKLLAAALFRYSGMSFAEAKTALAHMPDEDKKKLLCAFLGACDAHTDPVRELEHATLTFEVVHDQGGYYELKRHRMMTQSAQPLTTHLGYATPKWMVEAGFQQQYDEAMQAAEYAYKTLEKVDPAAASYVVPNAFNRRVLLTTNLRSANHLLALRSAPNAHFSIRRVAQRMYEQIKAIYPVFGEWLRIEESENWQTIEEQYFDSMF
ncbi:MAG: FAD-dependent thymidylate synthase [Anaerolineae bacterium]|jgi:thymidylate synthase ThyX|nr:FAD-dependent thymidylate synthase [Anaerolineae bacterium]